MRDEAFEVRRREREAFEVWRRERKACALLSRAGEAVEEEVEDTVER